MLSMLRCTSKSWNDFITSPSFLHSYLRQSMENAPQLLFVEPKWLPRSKGSGMRFVSVDMEGSKEELYTVTVPDSQLACSRWRVCAGLVCLSTDCRIYLCNPALQQLCELPDCSPSATPGYYHFGIGYLHSRKEYKVVHFFYRGPQCLPGEVQLAQLKCEVFTLNMVGGISLNRWKEIEDKPPHHPCLPGLLVNECMYWTTIAFRPFRRPKRIVSFDFENEKFLSISYPSSFEGILGLSLMDMKGMLCMPDARRFRRSSILDLWILKDKISCSWVKEYSIDLVSFGSANIKSFFMTWNEEIIFTHLHEVVIFYDLKRKCFRGVKKLGLHPYGIYSKSLFSLRSI
ncbi:F-box protein At3g07870-like [Nicotiana tomentosiformis]|uniref:F-box protein At3g07870-like n=1 Tax=Nicotiana tomentosiformis TaxID=4098 RepID=UPI00388C5063